ncbi:MAG: hypothetical protein IKR92_01510 [Alphaproteobacteria bacterium]|nr:hypothetical protein [Alphaproteobacteria bacterium]
MADDEFFNEGDDFEKLLNSFINTKLEEEEEEEENSQPEKTEISISADDFQLSEHDAAVNAEASKDFEEELAATFSDARAVVEEEENAPELGSEESELAQAFINYQNSINKLAAKEGTTPPMWRFEIDDLYPNYKPSIGTILAGDLVEGWNFLSRMFPDTVGKFQVNSSDEEFLNFAETIRDQDLQLAVISYVEILIDMESCELSYQAKLIKYQEKHIKKIMYEEYLARKERQRRFVEEVKKRNFPIDAERLISAYFRVAQKDVDGAFEALTTNPAIFAPIDFSKIKPRFFGLIKVSPKDGIRVNIEIGKFMKKLKI